MTRRWTISEDDRLRRRYSEGVPVAEIAAELGRTADALVARRALLGIPGRRKSRPWSTLEDQLLRAAAEAQLPATVLAGRLRRSVEQVRTRRRQLGLAMRPGRRYTAAEDARLRHAWATGADIAELAQALGRSPEGVRVHAAALGVHRGTRRRRWTVAEDAVVRDGYANGFTCRRIAAGLSARSPAAVAARAHKLGLSTYGRAWTSLEDNRLRNLAPEHSDVELARLLGRTPEAVRRRRRRLGVVRADSPLPPRAGTRWTPAEDALLRLRPGMNPGALAQRLGRSDFAVVTRLRQLGLRDGRHRSPHHPAKTQGGLTEGERRLVERALPVTGGGLLSLAQRLERSPKSIRDLVGSRTRARESASPQRLRSNG